MVWEKPSIQPWVTNLHLIISVWCLSRCHSELSPSTWYIRLLTVILFIAVFSGSTQWIDALIQCRGIFIFLRFRWPNSKHSPSFGWSRFIDITTLSRSLSEVWVLFLVYINSFSLHSEWIDLPQSLILGNICVAKVQTSQTLHLLNINSCFGPSWDFCRGYYLANT